MRPVNKHPQSRWLFVEARLGTDAANKWRSGSDGKQFAIINTSSHTGISGGLGRSISAALLLLCLTASPLAGQTTLDFFGYFESQLMTGKINNEWQPLQANKLRLDMSGDITDHILFGANVNAVTYHGQTSWQIADILPPSVLREVPHDLLPFYTIPFEDKIELDNAFIKMDLGPADITVGKQQISMGSGYAWNPTDIFNTKDLFDPTYEQPGHNAIRLDLQPAGRVTLTALVAPDYVWPRSTGLFAMKFGLSRFDLSLFAARTIRRVHHFLQFNMLTGSLDEHSESRMIFGGDLNGELFGIGVWTEAAYSTLEVSPDYQEWLLGFDFTFESGTYLMAEFYRNTLGRSSAADYSFNDWMRYLSAEQKALTRDQIYGFIQHPVSDLVNLGISSIFCLSDGSVALLPTLNWTPYENMEVLAYANWLSGQDNAVFNPGLGNGGLVRVRVYF